MCINSHVKVNKAVMVLDHCCGFEAFIGVLIAFEHSMRLVKFDVSKGFVGE